jgi:hypothetical protein
MKCLTFLINYKLFQSNIFEVKESKRFSSKHYFMPCCLAGMPIQTSAAAAAAAIILHNFVKHYTL